MARSLTQAFAAANDAFAAAQRSFPYATPWLEAELEATHATMGEDFHPFGVDANRAQIEMFTAEAFRLGLTSRKIAVDEYFADYLASS
jgi:4,5-dihydroxyphthalate decarboxylase